MLLPRVLVFVGLFLALVALLCSLLFVNLFPRAMCIWLCLVATLLIGHFHVAAVLLLVCYVRYSLL